MYGNATLATLVSKISMRVGSITARVINHLFVSGLFMMFV
jgi:hypothetical protein